MSKYTTELRFICETAAGLDESVGYNDVDEVIGTALPKIFDFTFPIFDEEHREELERKILYHFYTREIAFETAGLWKLKLRTKLNEIMPYYNKLYYTVDLDFNPLHDTDYVKHHTGTDASTRDTDSVGKIVDDGTVHETENGNTTTDGTRNIGEQYQDTKWNMYSDTPQGALNNITEEQKYLTDITKDTTTSSKDTDISYHEQVNTSKTGDTKSDNTRDTTHTENQKHQGEEEWTETMGGKIGTYSYSSLIKQYREQVINVDMLIIAELEELFLQLW